MFSYIVKAIIVVGTQKVQRSLKSPNEFHLNASMKLVCCFVSCFYLSTGIWSFQMTISSAMKQHVVDLLVPMIYAFRRLKIMLPDPLHFLAATNPISEFAASRNLLCNCLHTHLELWLIFLDHIVMLDEFLHLQSQNTEFKPNWDNEFRFSETLVATLSKMVITEILLMQKTTCKRSWNPRWVKSNMVSHLSYQCIVSCFLTTKTIWHLRQFWQSQGKRRNQNRETH